MKRLGHAAIYIFFLDMSHIPEGEDPRTGRTFHYYFRITMTPVFTYFLINIYYIGLIAFKKLQEMSGSQDQQACDIYFSVISIGTI